WMSRLNDFFQRATGPVETFTTHTRQRLLRGQWMDGQFKLPFCMVIGLGAVKREYLRAFGLQCNSHPYFLVIVFVEIKGIMYGESWMGDQAAFGLMYLAKKVNMGLVDLAIEVGAGSGMVAAPTTGGNPLETLVAGITQIQQVLLRGKASGETSEFDPSKAVSEFPKLAENTPESGAIDFQDWLYLVEQQVGSLAAGASTWWTGMLEAAMQAYSAYQAATPIQRLTVKAELPFEWEDEKYSKLEKRVAALMLGALPQQMKEEMVSYRVRRVHQQLFRLLINYQPGGSTDRALVLAQLEAKEVSADPGEVVAALRKWFRWLQRARDLQLSLPDPSVQIRSLTILVKRLAEKNPDLQFKISLAKTELRVESRPSQETALKFFQHLLAEIEQMGPSRSINRGNNTASAAATSTTPAGDPRTKSAHATPTREMPTSPKEGKGDGKGNPCKWFLSEQGCGRGRSCKFLHDWTQVVKAERCLVCGSKLHKVRDCPRKDLEPTNNSLAPKGLNKKELKALSSTSTPSTSTTSAPTTTVSPPPPPSQPVAAMTPAAKAAADPPLPVSNESLREVLAETTKVLKALAPTPDTASSLDRGQAAVQDPLQLLSRRLQRIQLAKVEEKVALLDSGASHAYRNARGQCDTLVPLGQLVEILGCKVRWTKGNLVVVQSEKVMEWFEHCQKYVASGLPLGTIATAAEEVPTKDADGWMAMTEASGAKVDVDLRNSNLLDLNKSNGIYKEEALIVKMLVLAMVAMEGSTGSNMDLDGLKGLTSTTNTSGVWTDEFVKCVVAAVNAWNGFSLGESILCSLEVGQDPGASLGKMTAKEWPQRADLIGVYPADQPMSSRQTSREDTGAGIGDLFLEEDEEIAEPLRGRKSSDVLRALQEVYIDVKMLGLPVCRLHADRAREFRTAAVMEWAAARDVQITRTEGDSPAQNGVAEQAVKYIKSRTRILLSSAQERSGREAKEVKTWWPMAAETAALRQRSLVFGQDLNPPAGFGNQVYVKRKKYGAEARDLDPKWGNAVYLGPARDVPGGHIVLTEDDHLWNTCNVRQLPDVPMEPDPSTLATRRRVVGKKPPPAVIPLGHARSARADPAGSISLSRVLCETEKVKDKKSVARMEFLPAGDHMKSLAQVSWEREWFSLDDCLHLLEDTPFRKPNQTRVANAWGDPGPDVYVAFGAYQHGGFVGLTKATEHFEYLTKYLVGFLKHHAGAGDPFTSVVVARNLGTKLHKDKYNIHGRRNITISFGSFDGGGVWIEGEHGDYPRQEQQLPNGDVVCGTVLQSKDAILKFDPRRWHSSMPWTGTKWTVIGYCNRGINRMEPRDVQRLESYGFPLPDVPTATLSSMRSIDDVIEYDYCETEDEEEYYDIETIGEERLMRLRRLLDEEERIESCRPRSENSEEMEAVNLVNVRAMKLCEQLEAKDLEHYDGADPTDAVEWFRLCRLVEGGEQHGVEDLLRHLEEPLQVVYTMTLGEVIADGVTKPQDQTESFD
ncbi:GIP, partial [Symbiodinium necroappetens]